MTRLIARLPLILSLGLAVFLALLALDALSIPGSGWSKAMGLALHLIPSLAVLAVGLASQRWPRLGAVVFFILAGAYLYLTRGREHWTAYLCISGPLVLIGLLLLGGPKPSPGRKKYIPKQ